MDIIYTNYKSLIYLMSFFIILVLFIITNLTRYQAFFFRKFGSILYFIWAIIDIALVIIIAFGPFPVLIPIFTLALGISYFHDLEKLRKYKLAQLG